jgi:hypothetical protein
VSRISFRTQLAAVLTQTSGEQVFLQDAADSCSSHRHQVSRVFLQDAADSCSSHRHQVSRISFRTQLFFWLQTPGDQGFLHGAEAILATDIR